MKNRPTLTSTRQDIFDFIVAFKCEHDGNSPTVEEIGAAVGLSSKSVVFYHLRGLEQQGKIGPRVGASARMITVTGGAWTLQSQ